MLDYNGISDKSQETNSSAVRKRRRRRKGKTPVHAPFNEAMADINFLRKRTAELLNITDKIYENEPSGLGIDRQGTIGETPQSNMMVDTFTFNFLIDGWAYTNKKEGFDNAIALLGRMEELSDRKPELYVRPRVRSYTKVINAIRRSGRRDAGEVAQKLFDRMLRLYATKRNIYAKPNSHTYNALLEAYSVSSTPNAASKAEAYLDAMIQQYKEGDRRVKPSARSYCAAIMAWSKSDDEHAGENAEEILHRMEQHYQNTGRDEDRPDLYPFNAILKAYGRHNDPYRADEFLAEMEAECKVPGSEYCAPDTVSYNSVIDAWAKSDDEHAAERAEEILLHMEHLYMSGKNKNVKPDCSSFNTVIRAWSMSRSEGAAHKAQSLLDSMQRLYESGNDDVRPDVITYCSVIKAWAKSRDPRKADRARNLLMEMHTLYNEGVKHLKPNVVVFNAVMNACAFTGGDIHDQNRAMEIAHSLLKSLEASDYGSPDHVTYGTFFKVCEFQMAECDSRRHIIELLFKKCCRDGQAGQLVINNLMKVTTEEEFYELTGCSPDDDVTVRDLPREWSANVIEGKMERRRRNFQRKSY